MEEVIDKCTGQKIQYIPSSVRPDGSIRKQVRIRPGYSSEENTQVYKSKGKEIVESREGYIPGLGKVEPPPTIQNIKANKRSERRRRRKEEKQNSNLDKQYEDQEQAITLLASKTLDITIQPTVSQQNKTENDSKQNTQVLSDTTDTNSKPINQNLIIRKYRKLLRQIEDLENSLKNESFKLTPQQKEKLDRKQFVLDELKKLK